MKKLSTDKKYCGMFAKVGKCEEGHFWLKVIYCGKDWCGKCQEQTHNRRIGRQLEKIATMEGFGFFTFTIPPHMRAYFQDKKHLSELRTSVKRKLKRLYGDDLRALTRWHWFGDTNLTLYNPHLNAMVDGLQYIPGKDIKELKRSYKKKLEKFTGLKANTITNPLGKIDIHYYFFSPESLKLEYLKTKNRNYHLLSRKKRRQIKAEVGAGHSLDEVIKNLYLAIRYHRLSYLLRPTFLVYQKSLAEKLKGYRNSLTWGKFPELSYEKVERMALEKEAFSNVSREVILLESGQCPICGKQIRWFEKLYPGDAYGEALGNGYYSMQRNKDSPSPGKVMSNVAGQGS